MVVPDRGDLVWLTVDQGADGRTRGRRPALVVSPAKYNERAGLAIMCPIASHARGNPFEVELPAGLPVAGVVLADHLRSADWRARRAELACRVPPRVVSEVLAKLKPI